MFSLPYEFRDLRGIVFQPKVASLASYSLHFEHVELWYVFSKQFVAPYPGRRQYEYLRSS